MKFNMFKKHKSIRKVKNSDCQVIGDNYTRLKEIKNDLKTLGLESIELVIGIDFTYSNLSQGGEPYYNHNNLHSLKDYPNPYQETIEVIYRHLEEYIEKPVYVYGFGDKNTTSNSTFNIKSDGTPCNSLNEIIVSYNRLLQSDVEFSGPTSFAPIINKTINLIENKDSLKYHLLVIICDGCVLNECTEDTIESIITASNYPLSIICIGVGKGPWNKMELLDNNVEERNFDNFHFVNLHELKMKYGYKNMWATHMMMELPYQCKYIKDNILNKKN